MEWENISEYISHGFITCENLTIIRIFCGLFFAIVVTDDAR